MWEKLFIDYVVNVTTFTRTEGQRVESPLLTGHTFQGQAPIMKHPTT